MTMAEHFSAFVDAQVERDGFLKETGAYAVEFAELVAVEVKRGCFESIAEEMERIANERREVLGGQLEAYMANLCAHFAYKKADETKL